MTTKGSVFVSSEIGKLKRVIVHRPDAGIARISPKRAEELLFDDIVFLEQMQKEHDIFKNVLALFLGEDNVLEIETLLLESIQHDKETKDLIISMVVDFEELPKRDAKILSSLGDEELRDVLITGFCKKEDCILFDPIPNFIFTRDIAVVVNDHVIITKAAKSARFRENLLTRFIFWSHPIFTSLKEEGKIINLNQIDEFPPSRKGEMVSIEGGDIMMIHPDYLLVGCSERSSGHAIKLLSEVLFKKGVVKNVVQINIPADRSFMHIDTIFTQVNFDHVAAFKPLVADGISSNAIVYSHDGSQRIYNSIRDFMIQELNEKMDFVFSGKGVSPYQEREQWTDGCNLVALKPGIALMYDRNVLTIEAFKEKGYQILSAEDLIAQSRKEGFNIDEVKQTIITLPSSELSRARGGSHCMTCPIERESI